MTHCITDNYYFKGAGEKPKGIEGGKIITSARAKSIG